MAHSAVVNASTGFLRFHGQFAPLMKREELIPMPTMVRPQERTTIPAWSEKVVVSQLEKRCPVANGLDILVDPQNVFVKDEGLAIAGTLRNVQEGCCVVQIINVTDVDLSIEAKVPLGVG